MRLIETIELIKTLRRKAATASESYHNLQIELGWDPKSPDNPLPYPAQLYADGAAKINRVADRLENDMEIRIGWSSNPDKCMGKDA